MNKKRKQILNVAILQFDEKGYHETTMAAIAGSCNISKATLYKFFPSKEELVLEAFLHMGNEMREQADAVDQDESLSPHDKLVKKLEAVLRLALSRMDFHVVIKRVMQGEIPAKYRQALHKRQLDMIEHFRQMVISVYGSKAEGISWDIALCMMGIMHELMSMRRLDGDADCEEYARFAVDCMDGIVRTRMDKPPLFDEGYINRHMECHGRRDVADNLNGIKNQAGIMNQPTREKVLAAAAVIEEHLNKGKAEWIIIEGMLSMLGEYPELSERVDRLRQSLECIGR